MSAGFPTGEPSDVWSARPATGRVRRGLAPCFDPIRGLLPLHVLASFESAALAWVLAAIAASASLALLAYRALVVRDVFRDRDGRFRVAVWLGAGTEIDPANVTDVTFASGLRPSLQLRDARRFRVADTAALDELIRVAPETHGRHIARLERRDYYAEARRVAQSVGRVGVWTVIGCVAVALGAGTSPWASHIDGFVHLCFWGSLLALGGWALVRLARTYGRFTNVRYLDGRRARRWLGIVRS